jgi:hypothetical protein
VVALSYQLVYGLLDFGLCGVLQVHTTLNAVSVARHDASLGALSLSDDEGEVGVGGLDLAVVVEHVLAHTVRGLRLLAHNESELADALRKK